MTISVAAFLSLLPTVTNVAFATFVYFENPRSAVNRFWSLTVLCLIPWGIGEFVMRASGDYETALLVSRYGGIGFCLIPAFFLHFALVYSGRTRLLQKRWLIVSVYASATVFAALQVSEFMTTMILTEFGYARTPSVVYPYYLVWLELLFGTGLFFCYRKFRWARTHFERKQTLFVILAVVIPLLAGSVNDALLPLMGIETLRVSVFSTTITAGLITYAIARFRLMALTPQATAVSILDTMGDLLAVVDEKGAVQYSNHSFRRNIGARNGNRGAFTLRDFTEEEAVGEAMTQLKNSGTSRSLRVQYRTSQGREIPVSLLVSGIFDQGEKIGYVLLARDVTEEIRLQRELEEASQQRTDDLRRYATSVQEVLEKERLRIARELHDDVCQRLSALKLELLEVEQEIPKSARSKGKHIKSLKEQIRRIIADIRRMSYNLRPTTLDDFGLVTALQLLCKDFQRSHDLDIRFTTNVEGKIDHDQVEITLYRIVQEALTNVALHANARTVRIGLSHVGGAIRLTLEDDGVGFLAGGSAGGRNHGLGLVGMRERSELLGGTFSVTSARRKGTRVDVQIPLAQVYA